MNTQVWKCPDCGCMAFSFVDERDPKTGKFVLGEVKRCHNCKALDYSSHHMLSDAYCLADRKKRT